MEVFYGFAFGGVIAENSVGLAYMGTSLCLFSRGAGF